MKNVFSIIIAIFILLSGMHVAIATHICGGEVVAVKWSFSGEKATCGMETPTRTCTSHNYISSNCCKNNIVHFSVDNSYHPSDFNVKNFIKNISQAFTSSISILAYSIKYPVISHTIVNPLVSLLANGVSLSDICVFRI